MAQVQAQYEKRPVDEAKPEFVFKGISLTLTPAEAMTLTALLRYVGGCPQTTARRYVESMHTALAAALPWNVARIIDEGVDGCVGGHRFVDAGYDSIYLTRWSRDFVDGHDDE